MSRLQGISVAETSEEAPEAEEDASAGRDGVAEGDDTIVGAGVADFGA